MYFKLWRIILYETESPEGQQQGAVIPTYGMNSEETERNGFCNHITPHTAVAHLYN
jgi:hypothetical protein